MAASISCFFILSAVFFVIQMVYQAESLSSVLADALGDNNTDFLAMKMSWKIYTGSCLESAEVLDIHDTRDAQALYDNIDTEKPLVFYMHGYLGSPSAEDVQTIVAVHLERGTDNIVILDWSKITFGDYIQLATRRVSEIAKILARTIDNIVELGYDVERIHLIGHSLGAQLVGFMGKFSENSLPRITGLDPAGPLFYQSGAKHIDKTSARFVDIIHTDGGVLGAAFLTGTVDFFANGGKRNQPGCSILGVALLSNDLCSHERSWRIYAESVLNERAFKAFHCRSNKKFLSGKCASHRHVFVGYDTPFNAKGSYYFTTNARSPYGRHSRNHPENELY